VSRAEAYSAQVRVLALRAAVVFGINHLIAAGMWLAHGLRDFDQQWVYSQAIGLSIWCLIDGGRVWLMPTRQQRFPTGWRAPALVLGGIALGYLCGSALGDWYSGNSTWELARQSPRALLAILAFTVMAGVGFSYFYYSRGLLAHHAAQAEEARRLAAETQLKLLESQLEPHMLFNTLANLRVLIAIDPPRAQAMLDRLIAFLRATLSASRSVRHPLHAEFSRIADYLDLMQVRMGPRLQCHLDLPADLADLPVPTLLLQPLVENAIKHGIEPSLPGGRIDVTARRQGQVLVLQVCDTGVGLASQPASAPDATASGGFGLTQVRQRLATLYGAGAHLRLAAAETGHGTVATLQLPIGP
jgi:signal transduction histidine kinase